MYRFYTNASAEKKKAILRQEIKAQRAGQWALAPFVFVLFCFFSSDAFLLKWMLKPDRNMATVKNLPISVDSAQKNEKVGDAKETNICTFWMMSFRLCVIKNLDPSFGLSVSGN